jgi:outer membrane protein OmpA-like peptidoglycan-associated protein
VRFTDTDRDVADELHIDLGWQTALSRFTHTNWINEVNGTFYTGGDSKPQNPIFLVTGIRHWFGDSGWALNAGVRWNVNKFREDRKHCEITELDDCSLGGLLGLTYAPFALAALPPPPPPYIPPPPPPPTLPQPGPVVAPRGPETLRTDEIHFEPASARLTNIAKAILDDVALRMKQEPASTAVVVGFTDNREATGANADLDRRRAEAVRDYLVSRHGIDSSRITVEARGTSDAIGDNSTAEGRLRNRRVEIKLLLP